MKPYQIFKVEKGGFILTRYDQAISFTCAEAEEIAKFIREELSKVQISPLPTE